MTIIRTMPEAKYHATRALSASGAWQIDSECAAIYWHTSPFNPDAAPPENGKALDIGTAAHLAILEPDRFKERTVIINADNWRTKAAQMARDDAYAAGLTPLLPADIVSMSDIRHALLGNSYVADLLDGAETEVSYFWTAGNGVACKARADIVTRDGAVIADLKASISAHPDFFQRRAYGAGHFLRAPWYLDGWEAATGSRAKDYWFVNVGTKPPHLVTIARLDERAIEWGRMAVRRSLDIFKRCLDDGSWPGYAPEPITVGLPTWGEYRLADREAAGDFEQNRNRAPPPSTAEIERAAEFLAPL